MDVDDKYYISNVQKLRSLFWPNFTEELLLIIKTEGKKVEQANYVLQIDSELYPYNGQRYVMIGNWVYIVGPRHYKTEGKYYTLYIEHTLNLEGVTVDDY
ncbi:MAG: hypothetical protein EOM35_09205 [Negativicutes bacterium]|nr:hypothetical protein [Negativicutes bacterium]